MPRPAKPYLERDWYISRPGGEYVKLCPRSEGLKKAKTLLNDHLKKRQQEKEQNGCRVGTRLTVSELFTMFLEAVEAEKSEHTFGDYQRWCVEHGYRPLGWAKLVVELRRIVGPTFTQDTTGRKVGSGANRRTVRGCFGLRLQDAGISFGLATAQPAQADRNSDLVGGTQS